MLPVVKFDHFSPDLEVSREVIALLHHQGVVSWCANQDEVEAILGETAAVLVAELAYSVKYDCPSVSVC